MSLMGVVRSFHGEVSCRGSATLVAAWINAGMSGCGGDDSPGPFVPPDPCPTIPTLDETRRERLEMNVAFHEMLFEAGPVDEAQSQASEAQVASRYARLVEETNGRVSFARAECRGTVCRIYLRYEVREPGDAWADGSLGTLYFGEATEFLTRREPCGFFFPGWYTTEELSCGVFEQRIYRVCEGGG